MKLSAHDIVAQRKSFRLDIPSFTLAKGEIKAILGPSGSGKTMLLSILGGLENPTQGSVELDGCPLTRQVARKNIAAVFQFPYLIKGTVAQNVSYGLKLHHLSPAEYRPLVDEALTLVGLEGYENRSVYELSGGEQQRVAFARAIVLKPAVLLLDEPLSSLDTNLKERISVEFAHILRSQKMSAVYVTHDRKEALNVADTLAVMSHGEIISEVDVNHLYRAAENPEAREFLNLSTPLHAEFEGSISPDGTVVELHLGSENLPITLAPEEINEFKHKIEAGSKLNIFVAPEDVLLLGEDEKFPDVARWLPTNGTVLSTFEQGERARVLVQTPLGNIESHISREQCKRLGLKAGVHVHTILTFYHLEFPQHRK